MEQLQQQIQGIFAELTRYPIEILDPRADLEEDLGIDSVKLAEILAATRNRLQLPDGLEVEPEQLKTIEAITQTLWPMFEGQESITDSGSPPRVTRPSNGHNGHARSIASTPRPPEDQLGETLAKLRHSLESSAGASAPRNGRAADAMGAAMAVPFPNTRAGREDRKPRVAEDSTGTEARVLEIMAEVTRYPQEILRPEAHLEDDLGIDSVKQAEILTVLRQRLELGKLEEAQMSAIQTVADVVSATRELLAQGGEAPASSPALPQEIEVRTRTSPLPEPTRQNGLEGLLGRTPFEGKIALITGSGHGIGKAIAVELARMGATLLINSFHSRDQGEATAAEIRGQGGQAHHIWGSAAKPDHLKRIFGEIEERFGWLDFLICNASNGLIAPIAEIREEHWERAFRTNVIGLHQAALMAAPLMARAGGGKIVTMSSPGAQRYIEHFACMGPVKAAVEALTRYLAIELAPQNIQVNAVSAGPVYGPLLERYPDSDKLVPYWESISSNQRLSTAEDVTHQVAYLLSPWADKVTGAVHMVDGGITLKI